MSKISDLIFKGKTHYITSPFGSRNPISTKAGTTKSGHNGTDYGTHGKKIAQYAIENGVVYATGKDSAGAKYVKVRYPRINKMFYHWHLDSISVKKGQAVSKGTKLGTTGMTGLATGVHLHLGIVDLATDAYIDPEKYAKEYTAPTATQTIDKLAEEVLKGKWGNGSDRRKRLEAAGYSYTAVQAKVNQLLYNKKKSVETVAFEVINGKWGNGAERKKRLEASGYNYKEVQKRVNQLLK
jgi:murein DD-endopeptidase MepM/ murein hydrolase activator NlpD